MVHHYASCDVKPDVPEHFVGYATTFMSIKEEFKSKQVCKKLLFSAKSMKLLYLHLDLSDAFSVTESNNLKLNRQNLY